MTEGSEKATNEAEIVTAALLVIGDEILSGRTADKNINMIARRCSEIGIRLCEVRVVMDEGPGIVAALNELRQTFNYVFTTGGIGPTHDDITAESVAAAFNVPLLENEEALDLLKAHYPDGSLTDARRLMARVPEGGGLVHNSISAAPGFMIGNVIVMAGVPAIAEVMLDDVLPRLKVGKKLHSLNVKVLHPESTVADLLIGLLNAHEGVSIGSYPYFREGLVGTTVVIRGTDETLLLKVGDELKAALSARGQKFVDEGSG